MPGWSAPATYSSRKRESINVRGVQSTLPWLLRGCAVCGDGAGGAGVLRATSSRHHRWSILAALGYHLLLPSLARRAAHRPAEREALPGNPKFSGVCLSFRVYHDLGFTDWTYRKYYCSRSGKLRTDGFSRRLPSVRP